MSILNVLYYPHFSVISRRRRRLRISAGEQTETDFQRRDHIELMLKSERERERTNTAMLEILGGFREQGEKKNQLLEKLVAEKFDSST